MTIEEKDKLLDILYKAGINEDIIDMVDDEFKVPEEMILTHEEIRNSVLQKIRDIFDDIKNKYGNNETKKYQFREKYYPNIKEIWKILRYYLDVNDISLYDLLDKDSLIYYLDGTWEMNNHDDEVKKDYYNECIQEIVDTIYQEKIDLSLNIIDSTPDELWQLFANAFCCGYYDKERFNAGLNEFIDKLKKSNYNLGIL